MPAYNGTCVITDMGKMKIQARAFSVFAGAAAACPILLAEVFTNCACMFFVAVGVKLWGRVAALLICGTFCLCAITGEQGVHIALSMSVGIICGVGEVTVLYVLCLLGNRRKQLPPVFDDGVSNV